MAAPQPTAADSQATSTIEASIALVFQHTTFAQFARGYKALRSIALDNTLSNEVAGRANKEVLHATLRGVLWFVHPGAGRQDVVDFNNLARETTELYRRAEPPRLARSAQAEGAGSGGVAGNSGVDEVQMGGETAGEDDGAGGEGNVEPTS
ncbi:uncharacterized protein AB675_3023 [Cyphellophora attinorum]|uniref:Uncharacterized protein n=1 Tax=Cyphellophora attinorum TaxID=1664694 RepID=A0A0N1NXA9_9EURO|nr:uncharacterized protein AB675_3023 [Phialophora attinorum]KPI37896.1 hypothetical protein AB675_3023 [Phialophora attinorum]